MAKSQISSLASSLAHEAEDTAPKVPSREMRNDYLCKCGHFVSLDGYLFFCDVLWAWCYILYPVGVVYMPKYNMTNTCVLIRIDWALCFQANISLVGSVKNQLLFFFSYPAHQCFQYDQETAGDIAQPIMLPKFRGKITADSAKAVFPKLSIHLNAKTHSTIHLLIEAKYNHRVFFFF